LFRATATTSTVATPSVTTAKVSSRWVNSMPSSGSALRRRTSSGISTLDRMPPSSSS
jgi:hypothetical protein